MFPPFDYWEHYRACRDKQLQRSRRVTQLPFAYHQPITLNDHNILSRPVEELVQDVQKQIISPVDILRCYSKIALLAHAKTHCLTEIMLPEAERWAQGEGLNLKGPLAGIPVSLKDSISVAGFDVTLGFSVNTGQPCEDDGTLVKILKAAGAIPYVKTNLPTTQLSFESSNDVWGRTLNPHNPDYTPGGSTGGEAALLAFGGSRIGVGSDVAGSVRAPAHFGGCYSLRCSTGRWAKMDRKTMLPGQEGIPSVFSPMARTLQDLNYFSRSFIQTKPWLWDHSVHPLEWRPYIEDKIRHQKVFKIGVIRTDGVVDPSPACARALERTVSALQNQGHSIKDVTPPSPYVARQVASVLLNSDGYRTFLSFFRTGETNDPGASQMSLYMKIPRPLKYVYYLWVKYVRRDRIWAEFLRPWHEKPAYEHWQWVSKREAYKALA
ncbi:hypothetical protein ABVK25_004639 [Lepraria finkii]|uniref:Amidase domain-containing protein n=1 Tax=Lepraria finkii TaxID=1340010 RepID=A0ABR4BBS1_9LECA